MGRTRRSRAEWRFRLNIAGESRQALDSIGDDVDVDEPYFDGVRMGKRGRSLADNTPMFGLLKRDREVRVVFPERVDRANLQGAIKSPVQSRSWVYSNSFRACARLDVAGFPTSAAVRVNASAMAGPSINAPDNFWSFAKHRVTLYPQLLQEKLPAVHAGGGVQVQSSWMART